MQDVWADIQDDNTSLALKPKDPGRLLNMMEQVALAREAATNDNTESMNSS